MTGSTFEATNRAGASQAAHWECGHVRSSKWKAAYRVATVLRTYRQIVADHRRQYPHQVKLANAGDCRDRHCSHKAREIMFGPLVQWFEGGLWVYGFKTAEQAAAFKAWSQSCSIDWAVPPAEQPPATRPEKALEGPVHGQPAVSRINS
jgi:hypothetical protein